MKLLKIRSFEPVSCHKDPFIPTRKATARVIAGGPKIISNRQALSTVCQLDSARQPGPVSPVREGPAPLLGLYLH